MTRRRASTPLGTADDRPRVYIWGHGLNVGYSHGPDGKVWPASGIGGAVESALQDVGERPAVIIWMGRTNNGQ